MRCVPSGFRLNPVGRPVRSSGSAGYAGELRADAPQGGDMNRKLIYAILIVILAIYLILYYT